MKMESGEEMLEEEEKMPSMVTSDTNSPSICCRLNNRKTIDVEFQHIVPTMSSILTLLYPIHK